MGRPGTAHQIFTSWAAARPGPSSFHLVGRSPSRLLEVPSHGPRPGPAHQTLSGLAVARPSPSHFQNSRPGPARPINVSNIAARPCPAHDMAARPIKDRLHMGRPDILVGRLMGWPTCCAVPKCAGRLFKRHQVVYGCIYTPEYLFSPFTSRRMSCFRHTHSHKPTRTHYPHNFCTTGPVRRLPSRLVDTHLLRLLGRLLLLRRPQQQRQQQRLLPMIPYLRSNFHGKRASITQAIV